MCFCSKCGKKCNEDVNFCDSCGQPINSMLLDEHRTSPKFEELSFSPPVQVFTPPQSTSMNGCSCFYHEDLPAYIQCSKCEKNLCKECYDAFGMSTEEFEGQALCYDCTQKLSAENLEILKNNKKKIIKTLMLTFAGMFLGGFYGGIGLAAQGIGAGFIGLLFGAAVGGCLYTFFKSYYSRLIDAFSTGSIISIIFAFVIGVYIELVLSIYRTTKKVISYSIYLKKTKKCIEEDNQSLRLVTDYMEYTLIRNQNKGVRLKILMEENSNLMNNTYAQSIISNGEDRAETIIRRSMAIIADNGEIIRNFAA